MVNYYFNDKLGNSLLKSENGSRIIDDMSIVKSQYIYWDKFYVIPEDGILEIDGKKQEVKKGNLLIVLYRNFDKSGKEDVIVVDSEDFYSNYLSNTVHNGGPEDDED